MKEPRIYLQHMQDAILRIQQYTRAGRDAFFADQMVQDAVVRNLEIMGEAAKNLPDEFRAQHTPPEWARIAGLRDVLIHKYFGVDLNAVWNVVAERIPQLRQQIEAMLANRDE